MVRKRSPLTISLAIAQRDGLPLNRMSSFFSLVWAGFGVGLVCKFLALLVLRNSPQNRHLTAWARIFSAQKGQSLVFGGLNVVIFIWYIYRKCKGNLSKGNFSDKGVFRRISIHKCLK